MTRERPLAIARGRIRLPRLRRWPGGQMLIKAHRLGMDQVEITFSDDGIECLREFIATGTIDPARK